MILLNNFYTIEHIKNNAQECSTKIHIKTEHPILKGHFPQEAVVPGVVILQIAKELLETHFSNALVLTHASQIKYLVPIAVAQFEMVQFDLSFQINEQDISTNMQVSYNETIFCKAKLLFRKK
ncbi:MAG: hypothetical protein R2831_04900 [Chitinophagaceae bacterium]